MNQRVDNKASEVLDTTSVEHATRLTKAGWTVIAVEKIQQNGDSCLRYVLRRSHPELTEHLAERQTTEQQAASLPRDADDEPLQFIR